MTNKAIFSDRAVAAITAVIDSAFSDGFSVAIKNKASKEFPRRMSRNEDVRNALIGNYEKNSSIVLSISKECHGIAFIKECHGVAFIQINVDEKEKPLMVVKRATNPTIGEHFSNVIADALGK